MNSTLTGERAWFAQARFGIFIHLGLYTLTGQNENACRKGRDPGEYARDLLPRFNPQHFNADDWVRLIQEAGARYLVITTKHAEGFCLWHTQQTSFNIANTPFRRDLLRELADACHRRGLRVGLYYSAEDWHYREANAPTPAARTYPTFVEAQLRELLTGYGRVDEIWFDCGDPRLTVDHVRNLVHLIHTLQPSCVVNDRAINFGTERTLLLGDFVTPERMIPDSLHAPHPFVECCDAMGLKGWGWYEGQRFWSTSELLRRLSRTAALGSNYLLNIEPQPDGAIRPECVERLAQIGAWQQTHGESIFNTLACPLLPADPGHEAVPAIGFTTRRDHTLYLHLHAWPTSDEVLVRHVTGDPRRASLLGTESPLQAAITRDGLRVTGLPSLPPHAGLPVIRVEFAAPPAIDTAALDQAQRPVVPVRPRETVTLHPETAFRSGRQGVTWSRINRFANGNVTIGHMIRLDCDVQWTLDVVEAGTYEVFADLGTASMQKDALFAIHVAGQTRQGRTVENGWYDVPARTALGRINLPAGITDLKFEILAMPRNFSDIHGLVLQPVCDLRPAT